LGKSNAALGDNGDNNFIHKDHQMKQPKCFSLVPHCSLHQKETSQTYETLQIMQTDKQRACPWRGKLLVLSYIQTKASINIGSDFSPLNRTCSTESESLNQKKKC
jgi:hypothetical protein